MNKYLALEVSGDVVEDCSDENEADGKTSTSLMRGKVGDSPRLTDGHVAINSH